VVFAHVPREDRISSRKRDVNDKAALGERDKRMVLVGTGAILLAVLVWFPLSRGAGGDFTLFLVIFLGIPTAVFAAVGLVVLIGGVWGVLKWPGRGLAMFSIGLAEAIVLHRFFPSFF
jgi:hypothetical protein